MNKVDALISQAASALHAGNLVDAERIYQRVLRARPRQFDAIHGLGLVALGSERFDEAVAIFTRAARLRTTAELLTNLGTARLFLGQSEMALECYLRAIELKGDSVSALSNMCTVLCSLGRHAEALDPFAKVVQLTPGEATVHLRYATTLLHLGRNEEALVEFDIAIRLGAPGAPVHLGRGNSLMALGRPEDALASYDEAVRLDSQYPEAHQNRGGALLELHRQDDALASLQTAIALRPDYAEAHFNLAIQLLLNGDYARGWAEYEWRKRLPDPLGYREYDQPAWTGQEDISGKTLLVYSEQGFGDTIQFVRFVPALERLGATVVLDIQPGLETIFRSIGPGVQFISDPDKPASFDFHCALLSLPAALGVSLDRVSGEAYLSADKKSAETWLAKIPASGVPRIGLAWSGSPTHKNDHKRSIPLATLAPLLNEPIHWISLQKAVRPEDAMAVADNSRLNLTGDALVDFAATAALIETLDLVITVDTSVAHLAGAMGKPVWLMVATDVDWRWLKDRSDSPWYDSVRIFRQRQAGDWVDVVCRVHEELGIRYDAGNKVEA
jgi:tetratricopeptide (TPR) repeat protein